MQSQESIRTEQPAWRAGVTSAGAETLGNKGPFYLMTVGTPCLIPYSTWVRVFEDQNGTEHPVETLAPGVLYYVREDAILMDSEVANGKGNSVFKRVGSEEKVTDVSTNPADNVRYLNQVHRDSGLRFIPAFEGRDRRVIQPHVFTSLLRPQILTPEYLDESPEVAKVVIQDGALTVYEKMFKAGSEHIKSAEFAKRYGAELQRLYVAALPTVAECYRAVRSEASSFLKAEKGRVKHFAAKGAHLDTTGEYYQYLLGAKSSDEIQPQTLVIQDQRQGQAEAPATVWCSECGAYSNLGPQGQTPKFCSGCKEPFVTDDEPDDTPKESAAERLARRQAAAKERNGK